MSHDATLVLGRAADVMPVASRLALERDGDAVLVCLRDPGDEPLSVPAPALRRSRELADRLERDGIEASARGALVVVEAAGHHPGALVERVAAAAGVAPVVALIRPRAEEDEELLAHCSVVLAGGAREPAIELLLDEMGGRGIPVSVVERRPGFAERLAGAGFSLGRLGGNAGQASVEAVALMPLLLAVVVAAGQLLAAGVSRELAAHSATAGAAALIQGRDARAAARHALPGWAGRRLSVVVSGRAVSVRLRPPGVPGVAALLEAQAEADAGPAP